MSGHIHRWAAVLVALALAGGAAAEDAKKPDEDQPLRRALLKLNDLTGTDSLRGRVLQFAEDKPDNTKKLLAVAVKMAKEKEQPFNRNATFVLAMAADHVKDVAAGATFFRLNAEQADKLGSERGVSTAYMGLIQMYLDNKKYAESEKACKEMLAIKGDEDGDLEALKPTVMRSMVLAIAKQGDTDRAMKFSDELVKADPKNFLNLALKARVLREAEKLDDAVKTYLDVIKLVEKETRLKDEVKQDYLDDYNYLLTGIYTEQGKTEKATEQLEKLLERDAKNPTYNNDLGYLLAEQGKNLDKAEKYIRTAIEEERKQRKKSSTYNASTDKDNASFLDSLGWVLFKQGKAKEAKPFLVDAVKEKDGQHAEIFDHLGEVCMALGEKAEAVAAWKKAVEAASDSKREKKIAADIKKKIEKAEAK